MRRALRRRIALAVAVAALAAGGAVAAVAATSSRGGHGGGAAAAGLPLRRDLPVAAGYLGISVAQLETALHTGRTLAQIADATAGKSEAGLIAALVAARRARLDRVSAKLERRVRAEVNRPPGAGVRSAILQYLGIGPAQLRTRLRAGRTLAQIADAAPGKSAAGLVAHIVATRRERLQMAVAAGAITRAQADARTASLGKRITRLVESARPPRMLDQKSNRPHSR